MKRIEFCSKSILLSILRSKYWSFRILGALNDDFYSIESYFWISEYKIHALIILCFSADVKYFL